MDDRRRAIEAAITDAVNGIRARVQIQGVHGIDRSKIANHALLESVVCYARAHPQTNTTMLVRIIVHVYSDNDAGACYMAAHRIARLIARTERSVTDAIAALERDGLVAVERRPGLSIVIRPLVSQVFVDDPHASPVWVADTLAPRRPQNSGSGVVQNLPPNGGSGVGHGPPPNHRHVTPERARRGPPNGGSGDSTIESTKQSARPSALAHRGARTGADGRPPVRMLDPKTDAVEIALRLHTFDPYVQQRLQAGERVADPNSATAPQPVGA